MEPALVTGVQKLKPCGTAVAGKLLPRENPPVEFVPRVVIARSDGWLRAVFCAAASGSCALLIRTSSFQPRKSAGPAGLSYPTRIRAIVLPAATLPRSASMLFHWLVDSPFASP